MKEDQVSEKYLFKGKCVRNWKDVILNRKLNKD